MKYFEDDDLDDDDSDVVVVQQNFDNVTLEFFKNFLIKKGYSQATINYYINLVRKICYECNITIDAISGVIDDYLATDSNKYKPIKQLLMEFGIAGFSNDSEENSLTNVLKNNTELNTITLQTSRTEYLNNINITDKEINSVKIGGYEFQIYPDKNIKLQKHVFNTMSDLLVDNLIPEEEMKRLRYDKDYCEETFGTEKKPLLVKNPGDRFDLNRKILYSAELYSGYYIYSKWPRHLSTRFAHWLISLSKEKLNTNQVALPQKIEQSSEFSLSDFESYLKSDGWAANTAASYKSTIKKIMKAKNISDLNLFAKTIDELISYYSISLKFGRMIYHEYGKKTVLPKEIKEYENWPSALKSFKEYLNSKLKANVEGVKL